MEIEVRNSFFVDGHQFSTMREAEERLSQLATKDEVFQANLKTLENAFLKYVPVEVAGGIDIFCKKNNLYGDRLEWVSLFGSTDLKYYTEEDELIKELTCQEWIDRLDEMNIDFSSWSFFIEALIEISEKTNVNYKNLLLKLKSIEITPEYIYE